MYMTLFGILKCEYCTENQLFVYFLKDQLFHYNFIMFSEVSGVSKNRIGIFISFLSIGFRKVRNPCKKLVLKMIIFDKSECKDLKLRNPSIQLICKKQ